MATLYEERFKVIHELLKEYGCEQTFSFHPEFQCPTLFGGSLFYQDEKEMHLNVSKREWEEVVDATLDVVVPTLYPQAEKKQIRFDIDWSKRAKLYSMYVSLPTSSRSVSLSKKLFKTTDKVIDEIIIWLNKCGCKKLKAKEVKPASQEIKAEQMALF